MRAGSARRFDRRELLLQLVGLVPLVLLFVQLLEVGEGVPVRRVEPQDLLEGLVRAIDEAAAPEVETEAEEHVRVLETREPRALQQRLVHRDGAADLPLLAVQVAEDDMDLERVAVGARSLAELLDRQVNLARRRGSSGR